MGNEMPNRNIQAGPDDNMQNQSSQQSSSDDIAAPIEKKMSKSAPLEIPEDDSGSGSKKEAINNKDAMASKVNVSVVDGHQRIQGKNSEENTQKTAISHEDDAAPVLDDKIIEPHKAAVPAEESIKRQERSSTNEEMVPNDTEYCRNKDQNTIPTKQEIAAVQAEDKHFEDNQTQADVTIPNQTSVNENMLPTLMNACQSTEVITDMSSSDAKNEGGGKKDPNMAYNEDQQAVDEVALQSGTREPLVMSLPSEHIQKMSYSQASLAHSAAEVKDIQNNSLMALQMLPQQHGFEEKSSEDEILSATESCSSHAESTKLPNGLQPTSEVKREAFLMHAQQKTMSTEEDGLKEPVKQPSGASNMLNEMKEENISTENKKINSSEVRNGFLHDENMKAKEEKKSSELGKPEIPTVLTLQKNEPEKQEVDFSTAEVMEKNMKPKSSSEILEENISFQLNSFKVCNRLQHEENIKAKEENISTELGKSESPTVLPLEKNEPGKQEEDTTAVETMEKKVESQSALDSLEENVSFLLRQGIEYKNNNVPEVEIGVLNIPNCLQSKLEPIQGNQGRTEPVLATIDAIQEPPTLLSPPEHMDTSNITLLQELKVKESSEGISNVVDKLEKHYVEQFNDEFLQNDRYKAGEIDIANGAMDGRRCFECIDKMNMTPLVETKDKPSSTFVIVSDNEVNQPIEIVVPEPSSSMYTIEVEGQDFNIPNIAANVDPFDFEQKEKALQSQNDWHTEQELNEMTEKEERDILEPEINKLNDYKDSVSRTEFTSNQTDKKSDQILQNSDTPIRVDSYQEQEDIGKASNNEIWKKNVSGVDTENRNTESGVLSILDTETLTWPDASITSTAGTMGKRPLDMGKEDPIQQVDKSKQTTSNSEMYSSVYVSCPTLESWHEESEDDPKTPLLATAPGSPEGKNESRSHDSLDMNDPRGSLERTDSEKIRTPLHHLFKDDSSAAVPEQIVVPNEQGIAKEKSVNDIWGSPAKLVSTPPSKEKQKTKSIFSQCICCSAVQ